MQFFIYKTAQLTYTDKIDQKETDQHLSVIISGDFNFFFLSVLYAWFLKGEQVLFLPSEKVK